MLTIETTRKETGEEFIVCQHCGAELSTDECELFTVTYLIKPEIVNGFVELGSIKERESISLKCSKCGNEMM